MRVMKLYVMRHGPAEERSDSGLDGDRALTPSGRERVRSVAKALAEGGEEPLDIVTSPLVRAVQTAEIVAITTKLTDRGGNVETRRELAPGSDAATFVTGLTMHPKRRVMIVGHEPDLSELASRLLGRPLPVAMGKAMVVGLSLQERGGARLRFVLEPKTLAWEHDDR